MLVGERLKGFNHETEELLHSEKGRAEITLLIHVSLNEMIDLCVNFLLLCALNLNFG